MWVARAAIGWGRRRLNTGVCSEPSVPSAAGVALLATWSACPQHTAARIRRSVLCAIQSAQCPRSMGVGLDVAAAQWHLGVLCHWVQPLKEFSLL